MIIEFKEENWEEIEALKIARLNQVKEYMKEEGLDINTYNMGLIKSPATELIEIDLSKVNPKQFRHIKRILSGKYDKFEK